MKRIPDDDWTKKPQAELALKYDTVENHGWYRNLDRTVDQLDAFLRDGHVLIDYSGGTGILEDRLLRKIGDRDVKIVIVDASPKFLRVALEKFGDDERFAFRWIRYMKEEKRLQTMDEVMPDVTADAVVSTNAIHLYYGLEETLRSWTRRLKEGGKAFVQSGNIRNPDAGPKEWIIDETVESIHEAAMEIAREEAKYEGWRKVLEDTRKMEKVDRLRRKYFLPVRKLGYYLDALRKGGFLVEDVVADTIQADVGEWYDFLSVYHEGVLGWAGGEEEADRRLALMRDAMDRVFEGKKSFDCCWTYITCRKAGS